MESPSPTNAMTTMMTESSSSSPTATTTTTTTSSPPPLPTQYPTHSLVPTHSPAPTRLDPDVRVRQYLQNFEIERDNATILDEIEMMQFANLYEGYMSHFGHMIDADADDDEGGGGGGGIIANCTIVKQEVGSGAVDEEEEEEMMTMTMIPTASSISPTMARREFTRKTTTMEGEYDGDDEWVGGRMLQSAQQRPILTIRFNMEYSTIFGRYNITNYNLEFKNYIGIGRELDMVRMDLNDIGIGRIVEVMQLKMLSDAQQSTASPIVAKETTSSPTPKPSLVLTTSALPTLYSSFTTPIPTLRPTRRPVNPIGSTIDAVEINMSFMIGVTVGVASFLLVVIAIIMHFRYQRRLKENIMANAPRDTASSASVLERGSGIEAVAERVGDGSGGSDDAVGAAAMFVGGSAAAARTAAFDSSTARKDEVRHVVFDDDYDGREPNDDGLVPQYHEHSMSTSQAEHSRESIRSDGADDTRFPSSAGPSNLATPYYLTSQQRRQHQEDGNTSGIGTTSKVHFSSSSPERSSRSDASRAAGMETVDGVSSTPINNYNANIASIQLRDEGDANTPMDKYAHSMIHRPQQQHSEASSGDASGGQAPLDHEQLLIDDASFGSSTSDGDNEGLLAASRNHDDNDYDYYNTSPYMLDGSIDEFDNYKNQDLETLRNAIERSVDGVDGMVSLAMAHAYTSDHPKMDTLLEWFGGEQDDGRIEASCLCDTYDWLKINEMSSLDLVNEYFQELLNRIVITVMLRVIPPLKGANVVHSCATILGLDLLKKPPEKTLVITGMRKTNTLEQGFKFIVKAFKPFGDIDDAAIAPKNHGFGIIRFARPESVELALEEYKQSEIDIQDVSVSVKTLKSERTYYS